MATASVVICAYTEERWSLLRSAVESAVAQVPPPVEVLLVVDHNDRLLGCAQAELERPGVRVLANTQARGLSGARNTGVAAGTGDVVVFLDDDAAAVPGWLASHVAHYEDPDVLGVGGGVEPRWETAQPSWFPPEFLWVVGCSYVGLPLVTAEVRNPIGANMSFRRSVLELVGGFSSALGRTTAGPRGCEETELAIRARRRLPSGRVLYEPAAVARHHVSAERTSSRYFVRRCWAEGLSKADVSRLTDPGAALRSERSYVSRTLPRSTATYLATAATRADVGSLARAGAIVVGLSVTVAGYASGRLGAVLDRPGEQRQHAGQVTE